MKNLIYNGDEYNRIFVGDNQVLIKYSMIPMNIWIMLKNKKIDFINTPLEMFNLEKKEKQSFPLYESKIILPYLIEYKTLYNENYTNLLNTEQMLKQLKEILLKIKYMHTKNIFHTDLFADNIMINKNFDIIFIDLDQMIIDEFISEENVFYLDDISFEEKKKMSRTQDKVDILNLYMYYLINGDFRKNISFDTDVTKTNMPINIKKEIDAYILGKIEPLDNYYFIDIIDELIKIGYETPVLAKRKGI